jgi:uncharacterized protein YecE (DUF72 family)
MKGGRFITHMKRLKDVEVPLANFFASGLLKLKEKLGPILWQFPPNFSFDEARFAEFFELLPPTTTAAATLAKKHDVRLKGRTWTKADAERPMRYAVEVRHESFRDERFVALLRKHGIALVIADTAGKWPQIEDVTADFIYARLHGNEQLYVSGYSDEALDWWASRFLAWQRGGEPADAKRVIDKKAKKVSGGRDLFVYFDNDVKVRSPFDAINLAARLAGRDPSPAPDELIKKVGEVPRTRWPGVQPRKRAR